MAFDDAPANGPPRQRWRGGAKTSAEMLLEREAMAGLGILPGRHGQRVPGLRPRCVRDRDRSAD